MTYLCFISVGKKSGNIFISYLWVGSQEIFLFPTCVKEVRKYFYFLPVGLKSGNIYVSYLWDKIKEIFLFPTCGEEAWEDFLLRKGDRRSNDFRWFPGDPWKLLS
jgi:hypothetical protein